MVSLKEAEQEGRQQTTLKGSKYQHSAGTHNPKPGYTNAFKTRYLLWSYLELWGQIRQPIHNWCLLHLQLAGFDLGAL